MKAVKNILVCLLRIVYGLIILLLLFSLLVSRPNFMAKNIEQLLNAKLPQDTLIKDLSFSKIELSVKSVAIRHISFTLTQAKDTYKVSADTVLLAFVFDGIPKRDCRLLIQNINARSEDSNIFGADGFFTILFGSAKISAQGFAAIDKVTYGQYTIENIYSGISATESDVVFDRASAQAYRGRLKADGRYQFLPEENIDMAVNFKDIDTNKIDAVNSKWKGLLTGRASYKGTLNSVDHMTVSFQSPSSEMEKTLLKYLMGNINDNLAFLPFSKILESADFIHLDNFQGTIHNIDKNSVSMEMNVKSNQLNLNLNPTITVNLR